MEEIILGRIESAEFSLDSERPLLYGLQLLFDISGTDFTSFKIVNINENCEKRPLGRKELGLNALEISNILKEANLNFISQLKDKPVEITFENKEFKSFRVLK